MDNQSSNSIGLLSSLRAIRAKSSSNRPATVKFIEKINNVVPEENEDQTEKTQEINNKIKEMDDYHYRNFAHMKLTLTLKPNLDRPQSSSSKLIKSFGNNRPVDHPYSNLRRSSSLTEIRSHHSLRKRSADSLISKSRSLSRNKPTQFETVREEIRRPTTGRLNRIRSANYRCKPSQKDNLSLLNHSFRYHIPNFDHLKDVPKHSCKPNYDHSKKYVFKAKPAPSKKKKITLQIATTSKKPETLENNKNETKKSLITRSKSTRTQKVQTDDPKKINELVLKDKLREQEKIYKDRKLNQLLLDHQKSFESFSNQLDLFNQIKADKSKVDQNSSCFKRFLRRITGQQVNSAADEVTPVNNVSGRKVVQTEFKGLVDSHEKNYRVFLQLLEKTKKDENASSSDENEKNHLKLLVHRKKMINEYAQGGLKFKNPPLRSVSRMTANSSKFSNINSDSSSNSREIGTPNSFRNVSSSRSHLSSMKSPSPTKLSNSSRLSTINRENQSSSSS